MRYHYKKPEIYKPHYGELYLCNHPFYDRCTLFTIGHKGLAVIQQRTENKLTWWEEIDPWLIDSIYTNDFFYEYFQSIAKEADMNELYPTVTIRQIMHALKMKPIKKEPWETVFDRKQL